MALKLFYQFNYINVVHILYILGKDQEDVCLKYNGFSDETKTLCCNKNCPKCGGKGCAEFKSKSGEILGRNQCCSHKIKKRGKICGSGERKAPCKLP